MNGNRRYILPGAMCGVVLLGALAGAVERSGPAQSNTAVAASWPRFRGPNGSGVAPDDKPLPVRFGPASSQGTPGASKRWQATVSSGVSSPCVWGDAIYLTGNNSGKLETICLDRGSGSIRWRNPAPAAKLEKVH